MKTKPAATPRDPCSQTPPDELTRSKSRGFTLVEVMVSMGILATVAGGVLASLMYSQRLAQSNLAQAYAEITAQSIIEQIARLPSPILMEADSPGIEILIPYVTTENDTLMVRSLIPWAADDASFTPLGTEDVPDLGVLISAAYIANSQVIRPERYMRMRVNLQRQPEPTERRVTVALRFQWEIPDRKNTDGSGIYLSGELRTVRSETMSF